jgi:hypothetical protein
VVSYRSSPGREGSWTRAPPGWQARQPHVDPDASIAMVKCRIILL